MKKGTEQFLLSMMFTEKTDPILKQKIIEDMTSCRPEVGLGAADEMFVYDSACRNG